MSSPCRNMRGALERAIVAWRATLNTVADWQTSPSMKTLHDFLPAQAGQAKL